MIIQELKEKLLATEYFINNEYLNKYCELVKQNEFTEKQENKTNNHHILPKSYFKMLKIPIDNSPKNLVNLLYKDHILAHYYLCLCTKGILKYRLANAFLHLVNRKWKYIEFNPETDLEYFQYIREEFCKNLNNLRGYENFKDICLRISKKDLNQYYIIEDHSKEDTEKHFNIKDTSFCRLLNYYNVHKFMTPQETKIKFKELENEIEYIKYLYIEKDYTRQSLANIYNLNLETMSKFLKIYNIRKPRKEKIEKIKIGLKKPVKCLETGEIFESIAEATLKYPKASISECLRGKQLTAGGLHWEYIREKDKPSTVKLKDLRYVNVECVETGKIFKLIKEAENYYNIHNISVCLSGKQKTAGGYHWRKLEEYENKD